MNSPDTLASLQNSRVFIGNLAAQVERKYGKDAAREFHKTCETLDELMRAVRDGATCAEAMTMTPAMAAASFTLKSKSSSEKAKIIH